MGPHSRRRCKGRLHPVSPSTGPFNCVTTSSSGLAIDLDEPCLACSPDGLVDIPELADPRGIYELKSPHTLAKESMTPQAAATSKKGFFYKVGPTGAIELRSNHDYFYQVQGTLAITKHSWCNFIVWTPTAFSVERISFDSKFWEEVNSKLIRFYKMAILPKLALPIHTSGQPIRVPYTSGDYAITTA